MNKSPFVLRDSSWAKVTVTIELPSGPTITDVGRLNELMVAELGTLAALHPGMSIARALLASYPAGIDAILATHFKASHRAQIELAALGGEQGAG